LTKAKKSTTFSFGLLYQPVIKISAHPSV